MVTIPIYQSRSEEIADALIEHVYSKYSIPECMIMDQVSAFMSILITYLFKKLGIKLRQLPITVINLFKQNMELSPLATIPVKYFDRIWIILAKIPAIFNV